MSTRRNAGDWVWLAADAGFVGDSSRLQVEIQPEGVWTECPLCNDPKCREWDTVWTEPDPELNGHRHVLYHVSECQMFDEPQG